MLVRPTLRLASLGAALMGLLAAGHPVSAQVRPQVRAEFGLMVATFALPEGLLTAYLPDDVAQGETFSGTVEGPGGFVLTLGEQRARAGERFSWTIPTGDPRQDFLITLADPHGNERARVWLQTSDAAPREPAFRFPPLVQAGKPFPIRGPLDGDFRTTRVEINGAAAAPLAESVRRVIVRAPSNLIGPTSATLTKAGIEHRGVMRSLSIDMATPAGGPSRATRELTVKGVGGIDRDLPLLIGGDHLYLRSTVVSGQPTFTVRREFNGVRADSEAQLVIPQSLREEVAVVLRTPPWSRDVNVARQHGDALNALDFDALPVAKALLSDSALGRAAVVAMLAADERRALSLILASMPDSGIDVQFVGLMWFLDHHREARQANAEAREAALRVLARVLSTVTAQLAVYVVGVAGSQVDVPMLERLYDNGRSGAAGLKDASRAALVRLGSQKHLDDLRAELSRPLPTDATYAQGVRLTEVLRTAAFTGHQALVPAVCSHITDPVVVEIDIYAYPDRSAAEALSAIVDGSTPLTPKRSLEQWKTYCKDRLAKEI
ncbi:MAG TPA: hypothetical protein VIY56_12340 [Vicinamibacterales bacterium]